MSQSQSVEDNFSIFPLRAVLLPGSRMALKIFEPRYLELVRHCLSSGESFGISMIHSGAEVGEVAQTCAIGTEASIVDFSQTEQGLLGITVAGGRRFRIEKSWPHASRLFAQIDWLDSREAMSTDVPEQFGLLSGLLMQIFDRHPELGQLYPDPRFDDADWLSWRLAEILPFSMDDRQKILEADLAIQRLQLITDLFPDLQEAAD